MWIDGLDGLFRLLYEIGLFRLLDGRGWLFELLNKAGCLLMLLGGKSCLLGLFDKADGWLIVFVW